MPRWLVVLSSLIAISLVALAAACEDEEGGGATATPTGAAETPTTVADTPTAAAETPTAAAETPAAAAGPAVEITEPEDGSTVPAGGVTVTVVISDFQVTDKLGLDPVEGEGHIHFYIDVVEIPTTPGQAAVTAAGTYHAGATTSYTWLDVGPGQHNFAVQLVNNDHTPLEPPLTAEVSVTVE